MGKEEKKTFVPDTNVLLYDPRAIFHFGEHDVILLAIVIEEIDDFKAAGACQILDAQV